MSSTREPRYQHSAERLRLNRIPHDRLKPLVSLEEAAELFGQSRSSLYRAIALGSVPSPVLKCRPPPGWDHLAATTMAPPRSLELHPAPRLPYIDCSITSFGSSHKGVRLRPFARARYRPVRTEWQFSLESPGGEDPQGGGIATARDRGRGGRVGPALA